MSPTFTLKGSPAFVKILGFDFFRALWYNGSIMTMMVVLAIGAGLILLFLGYYNRLVKLRNQGDESWSNIDVQLKRRHDLIPNVVETVKGYAGHERETLEKVTQARNLAMSAQGVEGKSQAENVLSGALKSLFALAENYPNLKANENFMQLQNTLTEVEDNIQLARRYYNAVVRDYNTLCESFPSVLVANLGGFKKRAFFEVGEADRENVAVKF